MLDIDIISYLSNLIFVVEKIKGPFTMTSI